MINVFIRLGIDVISISNDRLCDRIDVMKYDVNGCCRDDNRESLKLLLFNTDK